MSQKNDDFFESVDKHEMKNKTTKKKPFLRENLRSIKIFFILVGAFNLISLPSILFISENLMMGIMGIVNSIIGAIFVYIGIKLKDLIISSKQVIVNFLIIVFIIALVFNIYNVSINLLDIPALIFVVLVNIAVTLYLIKNVNKLSKR